MKKRKRKYTKIDYVFAAIFVLVSGIIQNPQIFPYLITVFLLSSIFYYLLTFRKYNRDFRKIRDHMFILSMVRYWKLRNKLFLVLALYLSLGFLSSIMKNPILEFAIALIKIMFFFGMIGLGLMWAFRLIKAILMSISPTSNYIEPIEEVDTMTGHEFEHFLAPLFRSQGYHVVITNGSGDFGADLILRRKNEKTVVQAKRYSDKNSVGVDAINEVVGAAGYYNAHKKLVIINSNYTDAAKITAKRNGVTLLNRDDLIQMINQYNNSLMKIKQKSPAEI